RPQTRAIGTVHYMAPEISNGQYTKSIDVYACGVILFEMLTGRPPFEGETDAEILMKHMTADADGQRVPERFRAVVAKALEKAPARRYESMNEMLRDVEACLSGSAERSRNEAPAPDARPYADPPSAVHLPPPLPADRALMA